MNVTDKNKILLNYYLAMWLTVIYLFFKPFMVEFRKFVSPYFHITLLYMFNLLHTHSSIVILHCYNLIFPSCSQSSYHKPLQQQ